jgi:hypothetical protein
MNNEPVLTNGMTDEVLIGYCSIHCETERALFNPDQINRMVELAGFPPDYPRKVDTWRQMWGSMETLCRLAYDRMRESATATAS